MEENKKHVGYKYQNGFYNRRNGRWYWNWSGQPMIAKQAKELGLSLTVGKLGPFLFYHLIRSNLHVNTAESNLSLLDFRKWSKE